MRKRCKNCGRIFYAKNNKNEFHDKACARNWVVKMGILKNNKDRFDEASCMRRLIYMGLILKYMPEARLVVRSRVEDVQCKESKIWRFKCSNEEEIPSQKTAE